MIDTDNQGRVVVYLKASSKKAWKWNRQSRRKHFHIHGRERWDRYWAEYLPGGKDDLIHAGFKCNAWSASPRAAREIQKKFGI